MKLPQIPEEDQEPKPNTDEPHTGDEPIIRNRHVDILRGMEPDRRDETRKEPGSKREGKTPSRPTTRSRLNALGSSWPDHPTETSPDSSPRVEDQPAQPVPKLDQTVPLQSDENNNPGRRLQMFEDGGKEAPPTKVPWQYRLRPNRELTRRAYWDVTATLSLIINVILVIVLVILAQQIRNLKTTDNTMNTLANNVLGGLYANFAQMDQASLNTTIMVDAQVPLNLDIPVSQYTDVVLTRDVSIPDAYVVINTGVLNINAQANITLPAGTTLPISLNLNIPVQTTIPLSLQVPVNIPLNQTELHQPFTGLQSSLRPLYCALNKNAQYPEGTFICGQQDAPTPGIP